MFKRLLRQSENSPKWIGAIQVQMGNSSYYTIWYSNLMLLFTFWYTAGYQISREYFPWLSLPIFVAILFIGLLILLYLDFKFAQPSRVGFSNEQACKHENPAMDKLNSIEAKQIVLEANQKKIMQKLGIE